jgi:hypothetical protein
MDGLLHFTRRDRNRVGSVFTPLHHMHGPHAQPPLRAPRSQFYAVPKVGNVWVFLCVNSKLYLPLVVPKASCSQLANLNAKALGE